MFRTFGLPIKSDLWSVYIPENTANGSILMPAKMEVELMNKGQKGYSTKIFWEHIFGRKNMQPYFSNCPKKCPILKCLTPQVRSKIGNFIQNMTF